MENQLTLIKEASAYILNSWTLGLRETQWYGRKSYYEKYKDAYRVHYLWQIINSAYELDGDIYVGDEIVGMTYIMDTYHKLWHYRGGWIEEGIHGSATTPDYVEGDDAIDTEVPGICVPKPEDGEDGLPGEPGNDGSEVPGGTGGDGSDGGDTNIDLPPAIIPDAGDGGSDGTGGSGDSTIIYETVNPEWRIGIVPVLVGENGVTFYKEGVPSPLPDANYVVEMYVIANDGTMQRNLVIGVKAAWGFTVTDILRAGNLHYQAIPIT